MYLLHRKKIDIYANISLFLSYSEVTITNRSGLYPAQMITVVTRSSPYPDQMITAVNRSSPYPDHMVDHHLETTSNSSERQQRPGHLDEPQRQIPSEDLVT